MKRGPMEIPFSGGDEYDYLTRGGRRVHHHKPGKIPAIKLRYRKRVRRFVKDQIADTVRELADGNI
jgi:hypothetical protein